MRFPTEWILAVLLLAVTAVVAPWPDFPYYDQCSGTPKPACQNAAACGWFEKSTPWCYDKKYESQLPPKGLHPPSDFVKKFFIFSFGTHLSEGSNSQIYYNLNVTECAIECLGSPSAPAGLRAPVGARCLSFDFYPFEAPETQAPYFESRERGVCVLNTGNKDTARLRNEDQGLTDAELFYRSSHFTKRPFSNLDGYYEIRDPRGTGLAKMLDYAGNAADDGLDFGLSIVWGRARWGIAHTKIPPPIDTEYKCSNGVSDSPDETPPSNPEFKGGYTPVDAEQHCTGRVTKAEAAAICAETGGQLCQNQDELKLVSGKKLGCSLDNQPMWSQADAAGGTKFVRCCANYGMVNTCDKYTNEIITKCAKFLQPHQCVNQGSGISRQVKEGFGNLLIKYRRACANGGVCKGLVEPWFPRDDCIFCLRPGTNTGECRPGNDYGICPGSDASRKALFSLLIKSTCGPDTICRLSDRFPDLGTVLNVPTAAPTNLPTLSPSTSVPTRAPTTPTTTGSPTNPPVRCNLVQKKDRCNTFVGQCKWSSGKCVKLGG